MPFLSIEKEYEDFAIEMMSEMYHIPASLTGDGPHCIDILHEALDELRPDYLEFDTKKELLTKLANTIAQKALWRRDRSFLMHLN